jgi:hypothetical protein
MEDELFRTLGTLSALGTTNLEFHDPETGKKVPAQARNIATHLRDNYALNILPDKITTDNRTDAGYALTEEGIKLAAVMLATRGIGGMAGWAKAVPAVQRFLALQRMQKVLNYGAKAYTDRARLLCSWQARCRRSRLWRPESDLFPQLTCTAPPFSKRNRLAIRLIKTAMGCQIGKTRWTLDVRISSTARAGLRTMAV